MASTITTPAQANDNNKLRANITELLHINKAMTDLYSQIEKLRKRKVELESEAVGILAKPEYSNAIIACNNHKICMATENKYTPLTYEFICKSLGIILNNQTKASEIVNAIKGMRDCQKHKYIKIQSANSTTN